MQRKRKTEITLEINQTFVIKRRQKVQAWCPTCAESVSLVTADEAATVIGVSTRTIYRWVEAEKLHFSETAEGSLLICCNSLS
jgi:excisionase family DNA binding protein